MNLYLGMGLTLHTYERVSLRNMIFSELESIAVCKSLVNRPALVSWVDA